MPYPVAVQIELARDERQQWEAWSRRPTARRRWRLRWRIVLAASDGLKNTEIAQRLAVDATAQVAQPVCV